MNDTIAAIATAPGQGGIAIVRLSGEGSESVLHRLFRPLGAGFPLESHRLTYGRALDASGAVVDECMAVLMRAPRSYTREDVCEFQLHGGSVCAQRVLESCLAAGARLAEPGEFTRRAFENGRIDLTQAEAVMALIAANGEQSAKAALRQLSGGASTFIRQVQDRLYHLMAGVEAAIDYPDEVEEEEAAAGLRKGLKDCAQTLENACDERAARILRTGLDCALCGRPNVGKSSLLNALLGEDKAIVTSVAGTTRDVISGDVVLGGLAVHLSDTAGLRATDDTVEAIGVARAEKALARADVLLLTLDASAPLTGEDEALLHRVRPDQELVVLLNKSDLPPCISADSVHALAPEAAVLTVSALDAATLAPLKARLAALAERCSRLPLTEQRHLSAARRAATALRSAVEALDSGATCELCAVDLRTAIAALGEITGDAVEERVLDEVFSRFCVGK